MNKNDFLTILDRKLTVINENERKDIIDEYRMHIEMKMDEGKSEEEAIEDFGDIDELVNEILDAYKINTDRSHNSFDAKINTFLDALFEGFKRFLGSFTSIEVDDVVKLIFEILIILMLLALLQIPFRLISSLGSHLFHSISGFGIGSLLATVWRIVIEVIAVIINIVIFINLCSKRVKHYQSNSKTKDDTVFDDFKNSFDFEKAKENVQSFTSKKTKEQTINEEVQSEQQKHEEDAYEYNYEYRFAYDKYDEADKKLKKDISNSEVLHQGVNSVVQTLMRAFFCILMIPFVGIVIALCCVLGAMIVLSFEGVTLFGAYFLTIGGLMITYAFLSLLYRVLWKRR